MELGTAVNKTKESRRRSDLRAADADVCLMTEEDTTKLLPLLIRLYLK